MTPVQPRAPKAPGSSLDRFLDSRMSPSRVPQLVSSTSGSESSSDDESPPNKLNDTNRCPPFSTPSKSRFHSTKAHSASYHNASRAQIRPISPCPSCGIVATLSSDDWLLLDCDHLICPRCINTLINSVSNDPPRASDCFVCGVAVNSFFERVEFREGRERLEMSPLRHFDWSESFDTPPTTPSSSTKSFRTPVHEIAQPPVWSVVRVDNVPWDVVVSDVADWMPSTIKTIDSIPLPIHILCNRFDGKTLNCLFIECPSLEDAQALVRCNNGKKLNGRMVSVVLTSQSELLAHIFPCWDAGFEAVDAAHPEREGVLVADEDLDGLTDLCRLQKCHTHKAPERAFLQLVTIAQKFPWHQREVYTYKFVARFFKSFEVCLGSLVANVAGFRSHSNWKKTLDTMLEAGLACPVFRQVQKSKLQSIAGIDSKSTPSTPSSTHSLRIPALDRLRHSPTSPSPTRFLSAGLARQPFSPLTYSRTTIDETAVLARETGVDVEVVRKILESRVALHSA